jgi:hypothetical protein
MGTTFAEDAACVVFELVLWVVTGASDTAAERRATAIYSAQSGSECRELWERTRSYKKKLTFGSKFRVKRRFVGEFVKL